jgi:hypothetical protein
MALPIGLLTCLYASITLISSVLGVSTQVPVLHSPTRNGRTISVRLFAELEELARIVDVSYCVGATGLGISRPFQCIGRCSEFENFDLVTVGTSGRQPSMSSCS